jgi:peptide/nickel transport system substrate-binding protein
LCRAARRVYRYASEKNFLIASDKGRSAMALTRVPTMLMATAAALALAGGAAEAQQFSCPKKGGEFAFGQEAKVNSLDMHTSSAISTRNIALNLFESLMSRDENFNVMPELAQSVEESKDGKTYVFKLRQGIKFHNGKPMTSADVAASYARYKQFGIDRGLLDVVDKWETPDAQTFVMTLKAPQPTFLENLSSFLAPIVIVPAENTKAPAMQMATSG